jgi:magnesium transporter
MDTHGGINDMFRFGKYKSSPIEWLREQLQKLSNLAYYLRPVGSRNTLCRIPYVITPMKRSSKRGLEPGSPVYVGEQRTDRVQIDVMRYSENDITEYANIAIDDLKPLNDTESILWVNVIGVHEVDLLRQIGDIFDIHPLTIEDIANTAQRPKFADYPGYLFCVLNMVMYDDEAKELALEHLSVIIGQRYIISFQEERGDVFDGVRERLRQNRGKLRTSGSDMCMYALMDAIVDGYFIAI